MDSYGIFHPDTHLQTQNSSFWTPKTSNFGFRGLGDFRETIHVCFNSGYRHISFLYPKKLSYSSSNAYIKKIRAREPGNASCLLKNLKNARKLLVTSFFVTSTPFSEPSIP